jgi:hypothetical protein
MKLPIVSVKFIWISIEIVLSILSFSGGDNSIIAGWLNLVWTLPFGVVFWFVIYEHMAKFENVFIIQVVGTVGVGCCSYLFWFVVVTKYQARMADIVRK